MKELLYTSLAKYYDEIYAEKDYANECEILTKMITQFYLPEKVKLLDVSCGTGSHILHLKKHFECTGIDKSADMLAIAAKKNPGINLICGDMNDKIKGKVFEYDVIISMFSSIAYLKSYAELGEFIGSAYKALNPGGMLIIEPWFESNKFEAGGPYVKKINDKMVRVAYSHIEQNIDCKASVIKYNYNIYEDENFINFVDEHKMNLFSHELIKSLMEFVEFEVYTPEILITFSRNLIVGIKK